MSDNQVIAFLMRMTTHIAQLHARRSDAPPTKNNAGENFDDDSIEFLDEDFAAWMGYRGEDEQRRRTSWPPEQLDQERRDRRDGRRNIIAQENRELWAFLYSLRDELTRRCSARS